MNSAPDELRLAAAACLTALVFVSSLRFARWIVGDDPLQAILDAFLLTYLIQYIAVGIPGICGVLNFGSIAAVAIVLSLAMWLAARRRRVLIASMRLTQFESWFFAGCALLVAGEVIAIVFSQAYLPPMANDALTYHLPAAVTWLQTGRLGLYETWFHNPANTYSPLAGSMFIAWLIAPVGNDSLARFVQAPALLFLFVGMVQLCRRLGASFSIASLIAAGAVLSRPFVSQAVLAKDDLFAAAFFITAMVALARPGLTDRFGPWRAGIAVGLLLSVKYTVILSLPLLLLLIDAPFRARWRVREWLIALSVAIVLAGPWYARNAYLTGNPMFPARFGLLPGIFSTRRSESLAQIGDAWHVIVNSYYGTTIAVAMVLALAWVGALIIAGRRIVDEPRIRLCLLGPPIGIGIFVLTSPYAEVRFVYPSLLLLFACGAIIAANRRGAIIVAATIFLAGVSTGFVPRLLMHALPQAVGFSILGLAASALFARLVRAPARRVAIATMMIATIVGCLIYVYWEAYLRRDVTGYAGSSIEGWRDGGYGDLATAWQFVRALPDDANVACANTPYTYPLYGFNLRRRIFYIPTRPDVTHVHDIPSVGDVLSGEQIQPVMTRTLTSNPDRETWLARLIASRARFLFIAKRDLGGTGDAVPPELTFALGDPQRFVRRFENRDAIIFEIIHP